MTLFRRWIGFLSPPDDATGVIRTFVATLARLDELAQDAAQGLPEAPR